MDEASDDIYGFVESFGMMQSGLITSNGDIFMA
jgi:hypothetical protein